MRGVKPMTQETTKNSLFKGIIPAMLTPMMDDETINFKELENQVERFIQAGVHGLFALGTNSEVYSLEPDEKVRILETVVNACAGRLPVYAGTGCTSTRETILLSRRAEALGVDALSVVTPYFAAVSQGELHAHYRDLAESVGLPILLYNIPARTGNSIEPVTAAKLSRIDNIRGIKDSSGNFANTLAYLEACGPDFHVMAGADNLILWTLLAGGTGAVSGLANVVPELLVNLYEAWASGDMDGAKTAQRAILPLRQCLALGNPNSIVKRAARLSGHPVGPARRPACGCSEEIDQALLRVLTEYREAGVRF